MAQEVDGVRLVDDRHRRFDPAARVGSVQAIHRNPHDHFTHDERGGVDGSGPAPGINLLQAGRPFAAEVGDVLTVERFALWRR
jgi:hypothetical protein